jgi:hypothetical protein
MKVVVREAAAGDLDDIFDWISKKIRARQPNWSGAFALGSTGLQFPASLTLGGQASSKGRASSWKLRTLLFTWSTSQQRRSPCWLSFTAQEIARGEVFW